MQRRPAFALILVAAVVVVWLLLRTRGFVADREGETSGGEGDDRAPAAIDAAELAIPGLSLARTGSLTEVGGRDVSGNEMDEGGDDFPRPETATLEVRFEPFPDAHAHEPGYERTITTSIRSPDGTYAADIDRKFSGAVGELVVEVPGVPIGARRVGARFGSNPWFVPTIVPVAAPRTTCRLTWRREDTARFAVSVRMRGAGSSARIDAFDGPYLVATESVGEESEAHPREIHYVANRPVRFVCRNFPGSKSAGPVAPITVIGRAGAAESVVFDIPSTTSVSFHVKTVDGRAIDQAHVFVWRRIGAESPVPAGELKYTNAGGPIFALLPGPYEGRVCDAPGYTPRSFRFEVLAEPTQDVEVTLDSGAPTTLQFKRPDGSPVANEGIWIGAIDSPEPSGLVTSYAMTDAEGFVRFPLLPPGLLRLGVGGQLSGPIVIRPDSGAAVVEVPARRTGDASLRVHLFGPSGRPMDSSFVWMDREGETWGPYTSVEGGLGSFSELEPGPWHVHVMSSWFFSEQVAPFDGRVILKPGETRDIEIRLKPR